MTEHLAQMSSQATSTRSAQIRFECHSPESGLQPLGRTVSATRDHPSLRVYTLCQTLVTIRCTRDPERYRGTVVQKVQNLVLQGGGSVHDEHSLFRVHGLRLRFSLIVTVKASRRVSIYKWPAPNTYRDVAGRCSS